MMDSSTRFSHPLLLAKCPASPSDFETIEAEKTKLDSLDARLKSRILLRHTAALACICSPVTSRI